MFKIETLREAKGKTEILYHAVGRGSAEGPMRRFKLTN